MIGGVLYFEAIRKQLKDMEDLRTKLKEKGEQELKYDG